MVRVIAEDREGSLWIGALGVGLLQLSDAPVVPFGPPEGLPAPVVFPVLEGADGTIWVGTMGGGLAAVHDRRAVEVFDTSTGLSSNVVSALCEDRRGRFWIGHFGAGIDIVDDGRIRHLGVEDGLPNGFVRAILEARDGTV